MFYAISFILILIAVGALATGGAVLFVSLHEQNQASRFARRHRKE